jgi:hypothetical protein
VAGLKAGHYAMSSGNSIQRPEYPRDFAKVFSRLEDDVNALWGYIRDEDAARIYKAAGEVIGHTSMIVEMAEKEGGAR